MKPLLYLTALSFLIASCSQRTDESIEYIEIQGQNIPKISPELITGETTINFSDWFEDIRLINLESTEGSLMRYAGRTYVGEKYIIVSTPFEGIKMFDQNGNFLRQIAPNGKGPCEVSDPNRNIFVDEKNDKLYIAETQFSRKDVFCIGIESGECEIIPLKFTGNEIGIRDLIVLDDSLMYCTTMQVMGRGSGSPLFCQTTSGKLLWEIKKTHPLGITDAYINLINNSIYFNYLFAGDTLYKLNNKELTPQAILSSERPRSFVEKETGSISMGINPVTSNLYRGYWATVEKIEFDERINREMEQMSDWQEFLFNTETGEIENYGGIKNDFLGWDEGFHVQFHHNGMGVATYEAIDLLTNADSVSQLPDISIELKARLENILETVNENDNPYLLVGKLKKSVSR